MEKLDSGLSRQVADEEELARFLTQSNHFNTIGVKPPAFLPSRKTGDTSVFRHGREPAESLQALGRSAARERKLYGAAVLKAADARAALLEVSASEPPPRHAVLRDWPSVENDPELQKSKEKLIAAKLASSAELVLFEARAS
jgi:hypothetical protein